MILIKKLGHINLGCMVRHVRSLISIRSIADSSTKKQLNDEANQKLATTQQEEIDWFSKKSTDSASKNGNLNDSNRLVYYFNLKLKHIQIRFHFK